MNPASHLQILSAFESPSAPLLVKGGLQMGATIWGVFDDVPAEIVVRNPLGFSSKVELMANFEMHAAFELHAIERKTFPAPSVSDPECQVTASFQPLSPLADPSMELIRIRRLGGTLAEVLTDKGVARAGMLAARAVWDEWSMAPEHREHPIIDIAYHVEKGSTVEHAAGQMEMTTSEVEEWIADYKTENDAYLTGMLEEARDRVIAQLKLVKSA